MNPNLFVQLQSHIGAIAFIFSIAETSLSPGDPTQSPTLCILYPPWCLLSFGCRVLPRNGLLITQLKRPSIQKPDGVVLS